jgi:hypothetical protein
MSGDTSDEHRNVKRDGTGAAGSTCGSVEKLTAVTNVGLVGVPLAYVTSQSVVITLIAVALAIAAMIVYVAPWRRR